MNFFFVYLALMLVCCTASDDPCQNEDCADPPPAVNKDKRIVLTVFYNNDGLNQLDQSNTDMVQRMCDAIDAVKTNFFVDFAVGAKAKLENGNLVCKSDCDADLLEACVAKIVGYWEFPKFVCCNNRGNDNDTCFEQQSINMEDVAKCQQNGDGQKILLDNAQRRNALNIPDCHLPAVAFNGIVDRCIKFQTSGDLTKVICDIFKKGNVGNVQGC